MADNELKLPEREMPMTVTKHMWSTFFLPKMWAYAVCRVVPYIHR